MSCDGAVRKVKMEPHSPTHEGSSGRKISLEERNLILERRIAMRIDPGLNASRFDGDGNELKRPSVPFKVTMEEFEFLMGRREKRIRPVTPPTENYESEDDDEETEETSPTETSVSAPIGAVPREAKMFKVDQLKDVPATEQLDEWLFWLEGFKDAAEVANVKDQRKLALDLKLRIGDSTRRIIRERDLMPEATTVPIGYRFFDKIVKGLTEYFENVTDRSIDIAQFNRMKQGTEETAVKFLTRVRQVAKRARETNEEMIRTRFIEGLLSDDIRKEAMVAGLKIDEVQRRATREEGYKREEADKYKPWKMSGVAQVSERQSSGRDDGGTQGQYAQRYKSADRSTGRVNGNGRENRFHPYRATDRNFNKSFRQGQGETNGQGRTSEWNKNWDQRDTGEPCERCGLRTHRFGPCGAINAKCHKCGETGHFGRVCKAAVNNIQEGEGKVTDM